MESNRQFKLMIRKITLATMLAILVVSSAHATNDDKSPFARGVFELASLGIERDDLTFSAKASLRCSAYLSVMYALFSRDFPNEDFSELENGSDKLLDTGYNFYKITYVERGSDTSELNERILGELKDYVTIYSDWLIDNYNTQGEYFGSSPSAKKEFDECRSFAAMMANTQ